MSLLRVEREKVHPSLYKLKRHFKYHHKDVALNECKLDFADLQAYSKQSGASADFTTEAPASGPSRDYDKLDSLWEEFQSLAEKAIMDEVDAEEIIADEVDADEMIADEVDADEMIADGAVANEMIADEAAVADARPARHIPLAALMTPFFACF
ncbi:hypothetical protein PHLCEN_2v3603 [Hermanssonia centrifuga]|uniref:Uncharacterized protein n=1 Tax=Hermanssonia centrifuga TaxID=98765 RepID=A0A2R6QEN5_9APHY|nr:hypothetical protein PHLCEN_2v3603 [Hermanssonia centrifuga]